LVVYIVSLLAVVLIPAFGFRVMPLLGFAGLLAVPLVVHYLPESATFLEGRHAPGSSPRPVAGLFRRNVRAATFLFWSATVLCLLLISGLFTWLPEIMRGAGYSLGSALVFFLALNLGGVIGMLATAHAADRFGLKNASTVGCLLAAVSIVLLSFRLPAAVNYPLSVTAGTGALGAQLLINSCVERHYLPAIRATALAWTAGIGRGGAIIGPPLGALIVGSGLDVAWNFYAYALVAAAAAVLIASIPRRPAEVTTVSAPKAPAPEEG
jgi:MFS family permease